MSNKACVDCGKVSVDKPNEDCYFCGSIDTVVL